MLLFQREIASLKAELQGILGKYNQLSACQEEMNAEMEILRSSAKDLKIENEKITKKNKDLEKRISALETNQSYGKHMFSIAPISDFYSVWK